MRARARGSSLRGRVLLAVLLAFLPLLALEAYLLDAQASALRERVIDERRTLARTEARAASSFISGKLKTLEALALARPVSAPDLPNLDPFLRRVRDADPTWSTVALSDADGWNLSSLTTPPHTVNVADRDYFRGAIGGRPTAGTAILSRSTGAKTLIVSVPVAFDDGRRGALSGALSLATVEAQLRETTPAQIEVLVVDRLGQQFIGPGQLTEGFPVLSGDPQVEAAFRGEMDAVVVGQGDGALLVAYAPAPEAGWALLLREPASTAFAVIDRQRSTALAVTAAATLLAVLLAIYLGSRLEGTYRQIERAREAVDVEREMVTRERDRMERVVNEMPVAVTIYDHKGNSVVRNAAYRKLLGGPPPATIEDARKAYQVHFPDGKVLELEEIPAQRALRGETVRGVELGVRNADSGEERHVIIDAIPLRDRLGAAGAIVVIQDITELKKLERQRAAFFDMASHEIKTPLTSLLGNIQLARRRSEQRSWDQVEDLLGRAEQGGQRLAELVRELLDVSRLEQGRLEVVREPVDLGALASGVVEEISLSAERHEIAFERPEPPVTVEVDPRRVVQIVQNLLDNAVRYSPRGGTIRVSVRSEGGEAVLRVADSGVGVPDDERAMLFERFYRSSRTQRYGGTGLGLFISRRIAEAHGGRLFLESSGPSGSTFALALQLAQMSLRVEPAPSEATTAT